MNIAGRFFRSPVRELTPESHQKKNSMPTMGGIFILFVTIINVLLWSDLSCAFVWIFMFCVSGFGAIGFWDDWSKIHKRKGISALAKSSLQIGVAFVTTILLLHVPDFSTHVVFPFVKWLQPDIGWLYVVWAVFIIVGCSNAVNLTDGLDGLAIGSLLPNFATFALVSYIAGHYKLAYYLHIPFAASAEMAIIASILIGASLGFLWYNTYPAQIFMGDVGSLSLGAGLALIALISKQEMLLAVAGGLFVVETISVIAQIFSVRFFKKRLFKMAPIHHHFELLGWPESKITARFGIITGLLCLLALITLKIR